MLQAASRAHYFRLPGPTVVPTGSGQRSYCRGRFNSDRFNQSRRYQQWGSRNSTAWRPHSPVLTRPGPTAAVRLATPGFKQRRDGGQFRGHHAVHGASSTDHGGGPCWQRQFADHCRRAGGTSNGALHCSLPAACSSVCRHPGPPHAASRHGFSGPTVTVQSGPSPASFIVVPTPGLPLSSCSFAGLVNEVAIPLGVAVAMPLPTPVNGTGMES